jgi:hypothetical protein
MTLPKACPLAMRPSRIPFTGLVISKMPQPIDIYQFWKEKLDM